MNVSALIELHEGREPKPYRDEFGNLTIGVGRNLTAKPLRPFEIERLGAGRDFNAQPLTDVEIDFLLDNDVADAQGACIAIFGSNAWNAFGGPRQAAVADMAFELGEDGLRDFFHMRSAIEGGDWNAAADAAMQSLWARQVPERAAMDAAILRTGMWPDDVPG